MAINVLGKTARVLLGLHGTLARRSLVGTWLRNPEVSTSAMLACQTSKSSGESISLNTKIYEMRTYHVKPKDFGKVYESSLVSHPWPFYIISFHPQLPSKDLKGGSLHHPLPHPSRVTTRILNWRGRECLFAAYITLVHAFTWHLIGANNLLTFIIWYLWMEPYFVIAHFGVLVCLSQNESSCKTFYMKMSLFCMNL